MQMPPVVILSGGPATRLYPVTRRIPKALLEVAGKPFIAHQLELLKRKGITRVVICIGYLGEQIQAFLRDGSDFGLSVAYSCDGESLRGTGGAVKNALGLLDDVFWVLYGDSYLDIDYKPILEYFVSRDTQGLMVILKNDNRWDKSNIAYKRGEIVRYDKQETTPDMRYIDYGLSLLRKEAFTRKKYPLSFDLSDVYSDLIAGGQMLAFETKQRFYEIGSPGGLEETEQFLKERVSFRKGADRS